MGAQGHGGRTREDDFPEINMSRIKVGGDLGGLIFVVGVVVCTLIGVPEARGFFGWSLAGGVVVAAGLFFWHRHLRGR